MYTSGDEQLCLTIPHDRKRERKGGKKEGGRNKCPMLTQSQELLET